MGVTVLKTTIFNIVPVGKPRQTQRDKWAQRACVMRYRAFADELRLQAKQKGFVPLECDCKIIFEIPVKASFSQKKKDHLDGRPHQEQPDKDNLEKAFLDALFAADDRDDCVVWDSRTVKLWGKTGRITVIEGKEK